MKALYGTLWSLPWLATAIGYGYASLASRHPAPDTLVIFGVASFLAGLIWCWQMKDQWHRDELHEVREDLKAARTIIEAYRLSADRPRHPLTELIPVAEVVPPAQRRRAQ